MRNFFLLLITAIYLLSGNACRQQAASHKLRYKTVSGKTMGTTYNISYSDTLDRDLQPEIDALLEEINLEVSTYIDSSVISRFNQTEKEFTLDGGLYTSIFQATSDHHFRFNFGFAREVYKTTGGAFDPTVMPLVNYWGFGYTEKRPVAEIDSQKVDSLMLLVGLDKIQLESRGGANKLVKTHPGIQLDFSALAKGYGVDEVARLLSQKGVQNYLVDIGGELICRGKNKRGQWWQIGINTPEEGAAADDLFSKISVQNRALATSGNYRNYYKVGETSYAHTINPKTGFPEKNILLSATVLTESCILADAYATAFMVMGLERAFEFANKLEGLEAYLIYSGANGELLAKYTPGMEPFLN